MDNLSGGVPLGDGPDIPLIFVMAESVAARLAAGKRSATTCKRVQEGAANHDSAVVCRSVEKAQGVANPPSPWKWILWGDL